MTKETKVEEKKLSLADILKQDPDILEVAEDREVTIEHKRLHGFEFTFLVPRLTDLTNTATKDGEVNLDAIYDVLSNNLLTKLTEADYEALKVGEQKDAIRKLFTEDEILVVFAHVMEGVEEETEVIKKK